MGDFPLRKDKSVANVFKAKKSDDLKDEYIKAVNVAIGGENVAMFPHPLFISNTIHMRKRADDNGRYGTCASTAEEVENK